MIAKTLVIQTAFLGDILLTAPMLHALRKRLPNASRHLLTTPVGYAVHAANPDVDRIIPYDKKGDDRGLGALWRIGRALKAERYDLVICPHRSFRSGWLAWTSGASCRIGYRESASRWAMTHTVSRDMRRHEVDRLLDLLVPIDVDPTRAARCVPIASDPSSKARVAQWLAAQGLGEFNYIGIVPGSVWPTKRWTPGGFAEAIAALERKGERCLLIGGPDDRAVEAEIQARLPQPCASLIGQTGIGEMIAAVSGAKALITNDSGPLHIASMNGVPTVAVFGSTVPGLGFGPLAERHRVVEADWECRPCGLHGRRRCPRSHFRCMRDIPPDRVLTALEAVLAA